MKNTVNIRVGGKSGKYGIIILITGCLFLNNAGIIRAAEEESPHNPSPENCRICHMKHSDEGQSPAWGNNSGATTFRRLDSKEARPLETHSAYNSPTHDMAVSRSLNVQSYFCLSCHNGVYSKLVKVGYSFSEDSELSDISDAEIDLKGDHPVGFPYSSHKDSDNNQFPHAVSDPGNPETKVIYGKITGTKYPLYGMNGDNFECTTCHRAHYDLKDNKSDYMVKLLRADNSRSAMCRDCHTNK